MKKGVFSVMVRCARGSESVNVVLTPPQHYLQPAKFGQLSLHAAANVGASDDKDVTLFFGLSGTGKTSVPYAILCKCNI